MSPTVILETIILNVQNSVSCTYKCMHEGKTSNEPARKHGKLQFTINNNESSLFNWQ